MKVSIIVAIGKNNQTGLNNKIPWNVKDDMKMFKTLTTGHHVLMGRKTYESIGQPLPNRTNLIITANKNFVKPDGAYIFDCSYKAMDFARDRGEEEIFICGGTTIYNFFMENKLADRIYLTKIDYDGKADTYFPKIDENEWEITSSKEFLKNDKNEYGGTFNILDRK